MPPASSRAHRLPRPAGPRLVGLTAEPKPARRTDTRAAVDVTGKDTTEVTADVLAKLAGDRTGDVPSFVVFGSQLSMVEPADSPTIDLDRGPLRPLTEPHFLQEVGSRLRVVRTKSTKAGTTTEEVTGLASATVRMALTPRPAALAKLLPERTPLPPEVDSIAVAPFFRPDLTMCNGAGLDHHTGALVILPPELQRCQPEADANRGDAIQAAEYLLTELLTDFPLPTPTARANVLAYLITPAIRRAVGLAPLFLFDGAVKGTGKDLITDVAAAIWTGRPHVSVELGAADETRKLITSALSAGASLVRFDEVTALGGPSLQKLLTEEVWSDRILGGSVLGSWRNNVTWAATGNNVKLVGDMTRRVVRIRLIPDTPTPWLRPTDSFRHPDLLAWVHAHRRELVTAVLTMVLAWKRCGTPPAAERPTIGSFGRWSNLLADVLAYAGVDGFLATFNEDANEADPDAGELAGFLDTLRTVAPAEFTAVDAAAYLATSPTLREALPGWLAVANDRPGSSAKKNIGEYLGRHADEWAPTHDGGRIRVRRLGHNRKHQQVWTIDVADEVTTW